MRGDFAFTTMKDVVVGIKLGERLWKGNSFLDKAVSLWYTMANGETLERVNPVPSPIKGKV